VVALPNQDFDDLDEARSKVRAVHHAMARVDKSMTRKLLQERLEFSHNADAIRAIADVLPAAQVRPDAYLPLPASTVVPALAAEVSCGTAAKAAIAAVASKECDGNMRKSLAENWAHKHRLIVHADVPPLGKVPQTVSLCTLLGHCVCKAPRSRRSSWSPGAQALHFSLTLNRQAISNSQYSKDDFTAIVEQGHQVLCLIGQGLSRNSGNAYFALDAKLTHAHTAHSWLRTRV